MTALMMAKILRDITWRCWRCSDVGGREIQENVDYHDQSEKLIMELQEALHLHETALSKKLRTLPKDTNPSRKTS